MAFRVVITLQFFYQCCLWTVLRHEARHLYFHQLLHLIAHNILHILYTCNRLYCSFSTAKYIPFHSVVHQTVDDLVLFPFHLLPRPSFISMSRSDNSWSLSSTLHCLQYSFLLPLKKTYFHFGVLAESLKGTIHNNYLCAQTVNRMQYTYVRNALPWRKKKNSWLEKQYSKKVGELILFTFSFERDIIGYWIALRREGQTAYHLRIKVETTKISVTVVRLILTISHEHVHMVTIPLGCIFRLLDLSGPRPPALMRC